MKALNKLSTLILSAAGLLLVVAACSKNNNPPPELGLVLPSYVETYIKPVDLFMSLRTYNSYDTVRNAQTEYSIRDLTLTGGFIPQPNTWYNGKYYSWDEVHNYEAAHFICHIPQKYNPEFSRIYDSLCVAHKDTEYSKSEKRYTGFIYPVVYRGMKLDIVSDADYDPAHPAGASLDDILQVKTHSAKEIVESGYDLNLCATKEDGTKDYVYGYPVNESLAEFNVQYRKLVAGIFYLTLSKAPATTSVHRFTVTYTDEDGRVLTAVTSPVTIQAGK